MEKNLKRVKVIAVLLIIILISAIAFGGLYTNIFGTWKNVLPKFNYGMELEGTRELRFVLDNSEEDQEVYVDSEGKVVGKVSDGAESKSNSNINLNTDETANQENVAEEQQNTTDLKYKTETRKIKANNDEDINIENFEKAKKIIQKRLETIPEYEYNIRLDNVTGELVIEVPNDENVEVEESLVTTKGKIEVIDYQTGVVLLDGNHIKSAKMATSTEDSKYQGYLRLQFDNEGTEKLKEISKEYQKTVDGEGKGTTKYVSVKLDNQVMLSTYFGEELTNGELNVPLGEPTENYSEYVETSEQLLRLADIINGDIMPLTYTLAADNYIDSSITEDVILIAEISFAVVMVVLSIYMIIKYKLRGFKAAIVNVGYIAVLSLVIRYAKVNVTLNSIVAFLAMVAINYAFMLKVLNGLKNSTSIKNVYGKAMKELYLAIIPVCLIAVIFTFMAGVVISSIGMTLFWGLFVQALYSLIMILALDII